MDSNQHIQTYTKQEQAFLICHALIGALFHAATTDAEVAAIVRRRLRNEFPHYAAEWLIDVIHYIQEFKDDFRSED